jgi:CRP-like cAMP-binding protein
VGSVGEAGATNEDDPPTVWILESDAVFLPVRVLGLNDPVSSALEVGERTDYPAGSTVYREGSYPRSFLVVRGLLRVYLTSPEGRQCLASTNHEGGSDEVHQHDHDQAAPG